MTKTLKIRLPYDPSPGGSLHFKKPSLAKRSFREECDINNIMAKYQNTNLITHVARTQGSYGDFSQIGDYQESLNAVIFAQEAFGDLPSSVRKRFDNNPKKFLDFVEDPENEAEARRLGLLPPEPPQEAPEAPPVPPAAPAAEPALAGDPRPV